jgi:glycine cleavage system H protein
MVAIFVAITFISLVLVDLGLEKWQAWQAARASRRPASLRVFGFDTLFTIPEGVHLSNAHTWSKPDPAGGLAIGADVLLTHAVGAIRRIALPKAGERVAAGQPLFRLEHDDRSITVPSPLTGIVRGVNPNLAAEPGRINSDPYGSGWICNLTPTSMESEVLGMRLGEKASRWLESEFTRLREFLFAQIPSEFALGATSQDGGFPAPGCLMELDMAAWKKFEAEFLGRKVGKA